MLVVGQKVGEERRETGEGRLADRACPVPAAVSESRIKRIRGLRGLPHTAPPQTYPPGPLSCKERMNHAMNPQKPLAIPLAKPITIPPSSQAQA